MHHSTYLRIVRASASLSLSFSFSLFALAACHSSKAAEEPPKGLPQSVIRKAIGDEASRLNKCYDDSEAKKQGIEGRVVTHFRIAPKGNVEWAENVSDEAPAEAQPEERPLLRDPEVTGCVTAFFRTMKFPAADLPSDVTFPFVFGEKTK